MLKLIIGGDKNKIEVSKIALGGSAFGTGIDKQVGTQLLDHFILAGGNLIDTARVYGMWQQDGDGASEKLIGKYLEERKFRDKVFISTKGGHPPLGNMMHSRLDRNSLFSDLSESLEFLKTSYTDIYFLHRDDENIPVSEIMPVLNEFVVSKKVRFLGASNFTAKRIEEANTFAGEHGLAPFCISQIQWGVAKTTPEQVGDPTVVCMNENEYRWYAKNEFPVMAYSPQAKGFFSKAIENGIDSLNDKIKQRFLTDENLEKLKIIKEISEKMGVSAAAVVLAFVTNNEVSGIAVVGCTNVKQLDDSLLAADFILDNKIINKLERGL